MSRVYACGKSVAMDEKATDTPRAGASPDDLFARLDGLAIDYHTHHHEAVFTVDEAKHLRGELPGAHCKSLFIRDKKKACFLVVCLEDRPLDMKALAGTLGAARLSFASPDRLRQRLGVEPGSVTPFAAINDETPESGDQKVQIILDEAMMAVELVNYHPLLNTMTTALSPAGLLRFFDSTGHKARIADLTPATRQD